MSIFTYCLILGLGATLVMDVLAWVRTSLFKSSSFNYAYLGRWFICLKDRKFDYKNITQAPAQKFERIVGWALHYLIGILLALIYNFIDHPNTIIEDLLYSISFGILTVLIPLTMMHPILGFGFFASKTPNQWISIKNSLIAHFNFGIGLFITQTILNRL